MELMTHRYVKVYPACASSSLLSQERRRPNPNPNPNPNPSQALQYARMWRAYDEPRGLGPGLYEPRGLRVRVRVRVRVVPPPEVIRQVCVRIDNVG